MLWSLNASQVPVPLSAAPRDIDIRDDPSPDQQLPQLTTPATADETGDTINNNEVPLYVIGAASGPHPYLCKFLKSSLAVNVIPHLGGWNEVVHMADKLRIAHQLLKRIRHDALVLFTDTYDVLIQSPSRIWRQQFEQLKAPFVITGEPNCWPITQPGMALGLEDFVMQLMRMIPELHITTTTPQTDNDRKPSKYSERMAREGLPWSFKLDGSDRYLCVNSGGWMAHAWAARQVYDHMFDVAPTYLLDQWPGMYDKLV
jgi:hypothetical protein